MSGNRRQPGEIRHGSGRVWEGFAALDLRAGQKSRRGGVAPSPPPVAPFSASCPQIGKSRHIKAGPCRSPFKGFYGYFRPFPGFSAFREIMKGCRERFRAASPLEGVFSFLCLLLYFWKSGPLAYMSAFAA
jgi:hypothetical protein